MFQHILVALDGSKTSNLALNHAIKLATECRSMIRGIYVVDAYSTSPEVELISVEEIINSMSKEGESLLARAKQKLQNAGIISDVKISKTDKNNRLIADVIAQEANKWPADLIIVGTHGRRGFRHLLLGSVAESIVRVATKPVLLIRDPEME